MRTVVVVSGGDAPGINAALAQFVASSEAAQGTVFGASGGLPALVAGMWRSLRPAEFTPFAGVSGSLLPSSREPVLSQPEARDQARAALQAAEIDSILLFGGDGTLRHVLPLLTQWGLPCVAIPTTIDNDVVGTEYTLGFDSACNYAYQSVDGIVATAHALTGRIFMIETLGGGTGYLALAVARGAGAHVVLLPEYAYDDTWLSDRLRHTAASQGYALLVISEGIAQARTLAETLPATVGMRVRDVRLGHAQRGGTPTHKDRTFARTAADMAHEALRSGQSGIVVQESGQLRLIPHLPATDRPAPDFALYQRINSL